VVEDNIRRDSQLTSTFLIFTRKGEMVPVQGILDSYTAKASYFRVVRLACIALDADALGWAFETWFLAVQTGDATVRIHKQRAPWRSRFIIACDAQRAYS
jgi:hypothetical protein